jgi:hypothetical protein
MRGHLTDEMLIDAADGATEPLRHARDCADCRRRLDAMRGTLDEAIAAEVPEPSPLYWEAFRAQVERRIDGGSRVRRPFAFWPALAAAAAMLVASSGLLTGLRGSIPRGDTGSSPARAWSALPPEADDEAAQVLEGALASLGEDPVVGDCRGLAHCLAALTDEEQEALAEAVRSELGGRKS